MDADNVSDGGAKVQRRIFLPALIYVLEERPQMVGGHTRKVRIWTDVLLQECE
jgi:hypothetical protein